MEQWLQNMDIAENSRSKIRATKTSRRERHAKAIQKQTSPTPIINDKKIYVYKRFIVEGGCGGGCGHTVLRSSFYPEWNKGTWECVAFLEKDDRVIYDVVSNTEPTCCSGFVHYDNFRAPKISIIDMSYENFSSIDQSETIQRS